MGTQYIMFALVTTTTIISVLSLPYLTRSPRLNWGYQSRGCGLMVLQKQSLTAITSASFTGVRYIERKRIANFQDKKGLGQMPLSLLFIIFRFKFRFILTFHGFQQLIIVGYFSIFNQDMGVK